MKNVFYNMTQNFTLDDFYKTFAKAFGTDSQALQPKGINKEIGHFNVFRVEDVMARTRVTKEMPYNRRAYYKISLISGHNIAEYADKVFDIRNHALLFATPRIPYHWIPQNENQSGYFCLFTDEFLLSSRSNVLLDELPIFKPGGYPVFPVTEEQATEIAAIFRKMYLELQSDYTFKFDLMRNYLMELIHYGQKLQPSAALNPTHNAAARVTSLFAELLERQFPVEPLHQQLKLRTPKDYADQLGVHVNHLNRVLKEHTGRTTTEIISNRIAQEAKILLKSTNWNVSEIAQALGFEETAHFSSFFRKQTNFTPMAFRG